MHSLSFSPGFSLVELSIVLVILGLLTGGILGGQALIKAAELRAVTTEFQQWQTAVNTFKSRYSRLPGDMNNATLFWPSETANGDGDGEVGYPHDTLNRAREIFLFWQHLALAGLIPGDHTGEAASAAIAHHMPGVNCPQSKYGGAGWGLENSRAGLSNQLYTVLDYINTLYIGGQVGSAGLNAPVLSPEQAWNIDTKLDDGSPVTGKVAARVSTPGCTTADSFPYLDNDSDYALANSATTCVLGFREAF